MAESLGPWVRLEGISTAQLPAGGRGVAPSISSPSITTTTQTPPPPSNPGSPTAPSLQSFIHFILTEAVPFIDSVAPKSGPASSIWKSKGAPKRFPSSTSPVHLYSRVVPGSSLDAIPGMSQFAADRRDETWFCRRSVHSNSAEKGTASWEEFVHAFKNHHAESEKAFTPTVIGAREAMSWDAGGMEIEVEGGRLGGVRVCVVEMKHKIDPKPLKNRTFPVVQISASLFGTQEFIVVSIPLTDFDKSPYAEFAKDKMLVVAAYASIERIRVLPESGEIEWIMATASDAGGVLPQWMQNMAVPGQIAKDVELFMGWIPSQRTDGNGKGMGAENGNGNGNGVVHSNGG